MVKHVNQSANAKMMVCAIHKRVNASVQKAGQARCVQIDAPPDSMAKIVNNSVNATTMHIVIISPVNVSVQPVLSGQNALIPVLVICMV